MRSDHLTYIKRCDKCQKFANVHHSSLKELHNLGSPWPFYKWGIDILGPYPIATGQLKFLVVALDYFTKWIETEPLATITAERIRRCI